MQAHHGALTDADIGYLCAQHGYSQGVIIIADEVNVRTIILFTLAIAIIFWELLRRCAGRCCCPRAPSRTAIPYSPVADTAYKI